MTNKRLTPGILGLALLYWSWTIDLIPLGISMAIILESACLIRLRFNIKESSLVQWLWLIMVIIALSLITLIILQLNQGIYTFVQWFPLLFFPVMIIQFYYQQESIPLRVLARTFNRSNTYTENKNSGNTINFSFFYFLLILIGSAINTQIDSWVFTFYAVIILAGVYHLRQHNISKIIWVFVACMVFILSLLIKDGLQELQILVEETTKQWLTNDWSDTNIFKTYTALGRIGQLKQSSEIIMRIRSSEHQPLLLHQANYSQYVNGTWHMRHIDFRNVDNAEKTNTWILSKKLLQDKKRLSISTKLQKGKGVLALPPGSYQLENTRSGKITKNQTGSVRIDNAPPLLDFVVHYTGVDSDIKKPDKADLQIPIAYQDFINRFVFTSDLSNRSPLEAAESLGRYFEKNFRYSLNQEENFSDLDPLAYFLNTSHKGHCEFYATAGTLILRSFGIPTRYVTGYSMSEYDTDSETYIIRQRHAHAWTAAYINNQWINFDYTPSIWATLEAEAAPWWQNISDSINFKNSQIKRWWENQNNHALLIMGSVGLLIVLIFMKKWITLNKIGFSWSKNSAIKKHSFINLSNSPFYSLIQYLEDTMDKRRPGETIRSWLHRLEQSSSYDIKNIEPLLQKHYEICYGKVTLPEKIISEYNREIEKKLRMLRSKST